MLAVSVARADFIITSTATVISSGPFAGDEQMTFRIQNDGQGLTAGTSKLLALDVTMKAYTCFLGPGGPPPNGHLFIHAYDADGSGINDDADFAGLGGSAQALSYIRAGTVGEFTIVSTNPPYNSPDDSYPAVYRNPTPYVDGQSVSQFEVVGAVNFVQAGIDDRVPVPFAVAVLPQGETVLLNGLIVAESGPPVPFNSVLPLTPDCPEPSCVGAVIALAGLLVRLRSR